MKLKIEPAIKPSLCILGGTGFVGRHLANALIDQGYRIKILTRRRERHRELLVLPNTEVIEADIHHTEVLRNQFAGCDTVINLVAILNERRRGDFKAVHVELSKKISQACLATGVKRLLHMSALNAHTDQGKSQYLRSKGEGEDLAHATAGRGLQVTSFRPSVIFGPGDHLFTRFAKLLKSIPLPLPLACPEARFAPVYVGDVVSVFVQALKNRATIGQRYDLCGPHIYSLQQLMEYTAHVLGLRRKIIPLDDSLSRIQAKIMQYMPGKPLTYDNYLSMQVDSICRQKPLGVFALNPRSIEEIVPSYLMDLNERGSFDSYRSRARHDD